MPLGQLSTTETAPWGIVKVEEGGRFTSLIDSPTAGRLKKKPTFEIALEYKHMIIYALHVWQKAYRKAYTNTKEKADSEVARQWHEVVKILEGLE